MSVNENVKKQGVRLRTKAKREVERAAPGAGERQTRLGAQHPHVMETERLRKTAQKQLLHPSNMSQPTNYKIITSYH